jgi:hypothetical protein
VPTPTTPTDWVDEIARESEPLENFSVNHASREALLEILEETYQLAGSEAVERVGVAVAEVIDDGRHPKSSRVRRFARHVVSEEHEEEIPPTSPLLKSSH